MTVHAGMTLFDYQQDYIDEVVAMPQPLRSCLYYRTGAGKSLTALAALHTLGHLDVVVICPPSTHDQWVRLGSSMGMRVQPMSHARFRMKETRMSKSVAVVADEMHLFGGQKGKGWRKLDTLAKHLQAPLILASATPNYNDAERCYCIQHILDPYSCKGGYLQWLYQNCDTEQNPFAAEPYVRGFLHHPDAASFLAALPGVHYLPDDLVYQIQDVAYDVDVPLALSTYGYNERDDHMVASIIEMKHTVTLQGLIAPNGLLHPHVWMKVVNILLTNDTVLVFAQHSTVIDALECSIQHYGITNYGVVTGKTSTKEKGRIIREFIAGNFPVLLGTAALATGTDGLDRVCDTLLILDDTDDDALRRQLIGRIMPRGAFADASNKRVIRLDPVLS